MTKLLTPQQIADILGVQKSTIYQWTHQGYIPHVKLGKLVRFRENKVMEWIEKRSCEGRQIRRVGIQELLKQ